MSKLSTAHFYNNSEMHMKKFSLGTFSLKTNPQHRFAGLVVDAKVVPVSIVAEEFGVDILREKNVLSLLDNWDASYAALESIVNKASTSSWYDENQLTFRPAIDLPRQVFCTGANYRKHVVDLTVDSNVGPEGFSKEELRTHLCYFGRL
jgi:hypothetical protein